MPRDGPAETEIEIIKWAGLLHDVGKIGIRDNILLKEGPLDREERILMNQHPTIGAEIVAPARQLANEAPLIKTHHLTPTSRSRPKLRPAHPLTSQKPLPVNPPTLRCSPTSTLNLLLVPPPTAETTRATAAETSISNSVNAESARAASLQKQRWACSITAETTRATGAESTITTNLNAEISRATAAEATKADLVKPVQLDNAAAVNGSCTTGFQALGFEPSSVFRTADVYLS